MVALATVKYTIMDVLNIEEDFTLGPSFPDMFLATF
jgi:hypothetical protein